MATDSLQRQRANKQARLDRLKEQAAIFGIKTDPAILNEIRELEEDLGVVSAVLASPGRDLLGAMEPHEQNEALRQYIIWTRDRLQSQIQTSIEALRREIRGDIDSMRRWLLRFGVVMAVVMIVLTIIITAEVVRP